jgi:hypothetical protein
MDFGTTLEPVPGACDDVDDIDLDGGVRCEIGRRAGRGEVCVHEMIVVPNRGRRLGREIGRAIRADGRHETEGLLAHDPLHVLGQDRHADIMALSRLCPTITP